MGGKVIAAIKRQSAKGEFRSNLHRGGRATALKITPEERSTAVRSAKVMGLNIAGVDLLRSNHGPVVVEVNSSPGLEGIERATGKDIADEIIGFLEKSAIPGKTLNYAKYDVVHVLNSLMEALRLDQGSFERLVAKVMSLPARRFLRSRRVSFLAGSDRESNVPKLLRGTYQSPILVQWQPAEKQERHIDIVVVQFS